MSTHRIWGLLLLSISNVIWGMIYFFGTTFKLPHVATFGSQLLESLEPHEKCWSSGRLINRKPQALCLKNKHILGKNHENSPSLGNL